jgi:hypothetical protein
MQKSDQMTRRHCLWIAIALTGCRKSEPPFDPFPDTVAGVWRRTSMRDSAVADGPDPVPRASVTRLRTATYEGPGKLEARAYALTTSAVGLDLVQRWRPTADTVFFNPGSYFVVIQWQQADRKALQDFVREIEKRLGPAPL